VLWKQFRRWRDAGTLERVHDALREQVRQHVGKEPTLSAAILDSQSVKTAQKGRNGYDAGKKIKGRKCHLAVDTLGLLLVVVVHWAGIKDGNGLPAAPPGLRRNGRRIKETPGGGG
jgi:putative transposase